MKFILPLLLLFALVVPSHAKASHPKHRSAHTANNHKSATNTQDENALFSGDKNFDRRVADYNLELGIARLNASAYKLALEEVNLDLQNAQQAYEVGGDDAETTAQAAKAKAVTDRKEVLSDLHDMLNALSTSNKMIRVLSKD